MIGEKFLISETEIDFNYLELLMHSPVNANVTAFANFWSKPVIISANSTFFRIRVKKITLEKYWQLKNDASRLKLYLQNALVNK